MKIILTPEQMKRSDEYAIKRLHIPSERLMERAGKSVVDEIVKRNELLHGNKLREKSVIVFCGKGNNGGDGFVVSRLLFGKNFNVAVVMMEEEKKLSEAAFAQLKKLKALGATDLNLIGFEKVRRQKTKKFDYVVDAMLGISFSGTLRGHYRTATRWCNRQPGLKIAVDIPTGLNAESGEIAADTFMADVIVTMSNPKIGFYKGSAKDVTGEIVVADIGIPQKAAEKFVTALPKKFLIEESDVRRTFPRRASNSHKHTVGKIFVLAGSKSMTGAALLCSQSAMRSGAGQVILGIPDSEYVVVAKRSLEVMPVGFASTESGSLSVRSRNEIFKRIEWSDIVLLGCGMSQHHETQSLIRDIVKNSEKPMVIDADGLNAIVGHLDILRSRKSKKIIVTPHMGEFSRLTGIPASEIERNRFTIASEFAAKFKVIVVLKGSSTVIADPKGKLYINPTGNSGMATAGSGDVLAGIIASFAGQGNSMIEAAINGVFVHGKSGDSVAKKIGMHGVIASDLIDALPVAMKEILSR